MQKKKKKKKNFDIIPKYFIKLFGDPSLPNPSKRLFQKHHSKVHFEINYIVCSIP